jgi:hypothetical protein
MKFFGGFFQHFTEFTSRGFLHLSTHRLNMISHKDFIRHTVYIQCRSPQGIMYNVHCNNTSLLCRFAYKVHFTEEMRDLKVLSAQK